ncbi:MAG: acyltransferase family protein [Sphingobium sp.]
MSTAITGEGLSIGDLPRARPTASSGYIPGLDGIRAICISLVMVAHYGFDSAVPGGLGVTIFFFLSGFLITGLLLKEQEKRGTISLKNFYARRFLRLSPELFFLILVSAAIGWLYFPVKLTDVVVASTYTTNYYAMYAEAFTDARIRWSHLWSLAVEEHFYLTFPLIMLFLGNKPRALLAALIAICVGCLLWRLHIVQDGAPFGFLQEGTQNPYTYRASDTRMDSIAYGCLTAFLFYRFPFRLKGFLPCWLAIAAAGALMLMSLVVRDAGFRETYRYSVQGIAMIVLFYGLFGDSASLAIRVLEMPILRKMGVLSYGAYLWHMEPVHAYYWWSGVKIASADNGTKIAMIIAGFALTYAMAHLSFVATIPLRNLRSKFHR